METYTFAHLPPELQQVHLALFRAIPESRGAELKARLIAASSTPEDSAERAAVNFAFVDANMVPSLDAALTAAHQALLSASRGPASEANPCGTKSAGVHGEIIFALHPTTNIGDALRTFGVGPKTRDLLVIRVSGLASAEERQTIQAAMVDAVGPAGAALAPTADLRASLPQGADLPKIARAYKLSDPSITASVRDNPEHLHQLVVTAISIKSVAG